MRRRSNLRQVRIDCWVHGWIKGHPGCSAQEIADGLEMERKLVDSSLRRLNEDMEVMHHDYQLHHGKLVSRWYSTYLRETRAFTCRRR